MDYGWHDLVGNIGVVCVLATYLLLQLGRLNVQSLWYSLINGLGAILIMVSLWIDFNLSSFIIEVAWLLISLLGVYNFLRKNGSVAGPT